MKAVFTLAAAGLVAAAAPPVAPPRAPPLVAQPAPQTSPQPAPQGVHIPTRVSARTLVNLCGSDAGACLTYVLGAADAYATALTAAGRPQVFCFPAGTTNQQISQSTVQYLRARPQEGGTNAAVVLLAAFAAIYPCQH